MIIEFNGLPGCGKTTLAEKLINKLEQEGIRTLSAKDIIYFQKHCVDAKIFQLVKAFLDPDCYKLNLYTFFIVFEAGFSIERMRYALRLIKLNYQIKRVMSMLNFDVLILDEGFVQYVTSIPYNKKLINKILINKIFRYIINTYSRIRFINCFLPIEITADRSIKRKSPISRYDNLNYIELKKMLNIKLHNLEFIREFIPEKYKLKIDLSKEVDENVEFLKEYILMLLKKIDMNN